jgi:hypothetical protein
MTAPLPAEAREAIRTGLTSAACLSCDQYTSDAIGDRWFRVAQFGVDEPAAMPSRTLATFCSISCLKVAVARL